MFFKEMTRALYFFSPVLVIFFSSAMYLARPAKAMPPVIDPPAGKLIHHRAQKGVIDMVSCLAPGPLAVPFLI